MTPSTHDLAAVVARLEKVEQQNRRLKGLGLAALVLGATGFLLGAQGGQKAKAVEADKFILRDSFGRTRAVLSITGGDDDPSPALVLYDENLRPRAALGVNKDGPGLYFTDPNGKHRAVLSRNSDGIGFDLLDADGKPRAAFHSNEDAAGFTIHAPDGKTRLALALDKDRPGLFLYDSDGKVRAALRVDKKEGAGFRLLDGKEKVLFAKP